MFPWNFLLDSQSQFLLFNRDIFFNPDIFFSSQYISVHHNNLKSSRYRNRIKKGITIFDIIMLSPKLISIYVHQSMRVLPKSNSI